MRSAACNAWVNRASDVEFLFLTGDLGYNALEPLRERLKDRFINAGVAEQNMVSVGAGLAIEGMNVWIYSIAPFCYARPFEQIRNDICQHRLPVKLVGNGGGYGYGAQGASHHALEDYGALLTLPGMRAFVPAFSVDVEEVVDRMHQSDHPGYLRLGRCEQPPGQEVEAFSPWRRLVRGGGISVIVVGPLAGSFWQHILSMTESKRPDLWVLGELPVTDISNMPPDLLSNIVANGLCVVEEHGLQGSVGQQLAALLMGGGFTPRQFLHCYAKGYPSGTYGSQSFHRRESGLEPGQVMEALGIAP
ncbi:MAG TPA: transketolase [Alphaproteobacteria bacterium]|nr:transketolase [Alphaproteobacteria bacterium]